MKADQEITMVDENEEQAPFTYAISSYGADFDVDGLIRRMQRRDVYVPPFQRSFVWTQNQASRFVESLLLGLPVPGIFLSRDESTEQLLVIDGNQRLNSLLYFYEGIWPALSSSSADRSGREFKLTGIESKHKNATYRTLPPEDRRRLDNSIIHATIIRQEQPDDGNSSVYFVFERLNTGGTLLEPQEIRAALYHGAFNTCLEELNGVPAWRSLYGPISPRRRDQELLLRFFALNYKAVIYDKPLKAFLNKFMSSNRQLKEVSKEQLISALRPTVETILTCVGERAFKPKRALNAALFDAVMVGVSHRLRRGPILNPVSFRAQYSQLLEDPSFAKATQTATTDSENVKDRLRLATNAFELVE